MGGDFTYQDANVYYKNLDKLIRYANERQLNGSDINLLYSTPSCYLKSLHDAGITWPTKDDDFFPYASDPHAYWTGYFTSRPTLKRYERVGNNFLQVCKQLTALAPTSSPELIPHLSFFRETMGVMQHHDAVTGTEKQKVAYDYAKRLEVAMRACNGNLHKILNQLTVGKIAKPLDSDEDKPVDSKNSNYKFEFKSCTLLNISLCEVSENTDKFILTLYNPLGHEIFEYVRVPVMDVNYIVLDYKGIEVPSQIVPIPESIRNLKFRSSNATYELVILAELPPLGYTSYYINKLNETRLPPVPSEPKTTSFTTISNEYISLAFDTNGYLNSFTLNGTTHIINQEFLYYEAAIGNNREFRNRSSGAYIFRPDTDDIRLLTVAPAITKYSGSLVEEVHQVFNDWVSQVVRVYRKQQFAEFEWLIGPIPVENDGIGKEIITRFNSDIQSNGVFYTDSNGREMIKRKRNHRDTWKVKLAEKTAGNYYPVTTKIALEDENFRMAILTDRAQGGSSMGDGSLELMIHRRLLHDDAFGVDESLNETAYGEGLIARGTHYLIMGKSDLKNTPTTQASERIVQCMKLLPSWKFFSNAKDIDYDTWRLNTNYFTLLSSSVPKNVHLLTLEPWHDNELLIRFEHIFEQYEDPLMSTVVQFNVKDVLQNFKIIDIRETTLDGNAWLLENRRMEFVPDPEGVDYNLYATVPKSIRHVQLQSAAKPLIDSKYIDEFLPVGNGLGVDAQRPKRQISKLNKDMKMNRLHSKEMHKNQLNLDDEDTKFIIELEPMQIRTFILYLEVGI